MNVIQEIRESAEMFKKIRRHIHAHPELGYEVHKTSDLVSSKLEEWGIEVTRGVGRTGLVGTLRRGEGSRTIGLRADMDALPIQEANSFEHRSQIDGAMHACGHDGHTVMLLCAAYYLAKYGQFDGTVHFIFQPAEEGGAGGQAMVEDGMFARFPCDFIFGLHNWPGLAEGRIGTRPGALMAGSAVFEVVVRGIGSHAAMPHASADALLAASYIVVALQSVVSRNVDPIDSAVVSVVKFNSGTATNVIANEARLVGAVRSFSDDLIRKIEHRVRDIASNVAQAYGCRAELGYKLTYPTTVNDAKATEFALRAAAATVGSENVNASVRPTMAGEDFAFMLKATPGCYAFVGNGSGDHRGGHAGCGPCELHNDSYDFNDSLLPVGASYFANLVRQHLKRD